jgi:tetratricopeptide (TPR) repeat protein
MASIDFQIDFKDMLLTARQSFREGNYRVAEQLLNQLVVKDSRSPEIFQMLATIYYDQGKFNKAIQTFRRALEIDPAYTDASVGLSIILNDLGRYEEGKKVFQDAQAALNRKSLPQQSYLNEKLASKHDELGELYFQHKQYPAALEQYSRALELSSRHPELRMKMVECRIKLEETANAIRELERLVQEYPSFSPARLKLGLLYYQAKNVVAAIEQWETILLKDPQHPVATRYLQMAQEAGPSLSI